MEFWMSEKFVVVDPSATQNLCSYFSSPHKDIFLRHLHLYSPLFCHPSCCWSYDELEVAFEEREALTLSGQEKLFLNRKQNNFLTFYINDLILKSPFVRHSNSVFSWFCSLGSHVYYPIILHLLYNL